MPTFQLSRSAEQLLTTWRAMLDTLPDMPSHRAVVIDGPVMSPEMSPRDIDYAGYDVGSIVQGY